MPKRKGPWVDPDLRVLAGCDENGWLVTRSKRGVPMAYYRGAFGQWASFCWFGGRDRNFYRVFVNGTAIGSTPTIEGLKALIREAENRINVAAAEAREARAARSP